MKPTDPPPSTESVAIDGQSVRLGRRRPVQPVTVAALRRYIRWAEVAAAPPPESVDYAAKAQASISRMYLNDQYGDCVIAGKYHAEGVWSGNDTDSLGVVLGTDQEVLTAYHAICGPGDNGCIITEVLDAFQRTGLKFGGSVRKIDGYAAVDWTDKLEVQVALYLFGALAIGVDLPQAWADSRDVWDVTNSRIVGGHDVTCVGYNPQGVVISTWGGLRVITWPAFQSKKWLGECWAMLAPDWYGKDQVAPVPGLDIATLKADLAALANGQTPTIPPVTLTWDDIWPTREA